ncbi:MAG: CHAT domain-containing protein [Symploca sp. SIO2B6]|nr:CHAT domain-containing protein [Symploca sp. SIO2B6]
MPATGKLVILKLDGDVERQGFRVTLAIGSEGDRSSIEVTGELPPAPELVTQLQHHWLGKYRSLATPYRIKARRITYGTSLTECQKSALELGERLRAWLNCEQFRLIDRRLREALNPEEEIRLLIRTEDKHLQKLPWHLWDLFERYPKAEAILSALKFERLSQPIATKPKSKVKILAILGHSEGIDIEADRQLLEALPQAQITFLVEKTRKEINDQLWEQPWDIIFFAGHSNTEGETGRIYINPEESLTIDELWYALRTAVKKGLNLAIFNSCEGLGLALRLSDLHIPQIIVMRELVPDQVAQEFLKYFLRAFAGGKSFHLAEREARERLQGLEHEFPCASWLPIIFQNPAAIPPTWSQLAGLALCPYLGLSAFQEEDTKFFKGRETFTQKLLAATTKKPLVSVVGASGSGKSSVVLAGLIPRLRAMGKVQIVCFRPGNSPFEALAAALLSLWQTQAQQQEKQQEQDLAENSGPIKGLLTEIGNRRQQLTPKVWERFLGKESNQDLTELTTELWDNANSLYEIIESIVQTNPGTRLVLVADQFEELYTLSPEAECLCFLERLLNAVNQAPGFTLVLTLRADFFGRALAYEPLVKAWHDYPPELLGPMNREELSRAITLPAAEMKVQLEEGLTKRLIDDIGVQPGRLPLLEFALTQLWSKQKDGFLTHQAYSDIGGVEEALAKHAEAVYSQLSKTDRQRAQRVFMQLVRLGEETEATRRLATREQVKEENWDLVTRLASSRLVVTNRNQSHGIETVEIAHEALIKSWGRLEQWMLLDGAFRRWQEQLRTARGQWENSDFDEGALLRGKPLSDAEDWQQKRREELSDSERVFIKLSLERWESQLKKEKRRQQRTILGLASGLVLAVSLSAVSWWQWQKALLSEIKAITTSSETLLASNQELDALIEAIKAKQKLRRLGSKDLAIKTQVESVLRQGIYGVVEYNRLSGHDDWIWGVAVSPDSKIIASVSKDKTIKLWNRDGSLLNTLVGHRANVWGVAFSPDSELIASVSFDKTVKLWNRDGSLLITLKGHNKSVSQVAFSPDSQTIVTSSRDQTVKIWSRDGTLLNTLVGHSDKVWGVAVSPDSQIIVSGGWDKTVKIWSKDGSLLKTLTGHSDWVWGVAVSPDSQIIASASSDKTVKLWNRDGSLLNTLVGHRGAVIGVAFSPDSQTLATASKDKTVKIWSRNGTLLKTLQGHGDEVWGIAFSPDSRMIVSAGGDQTIKLWKTKSPLLHSFNGHGNQVYGIAFSPDSQRIVSASGDNTLKIWSRDGTLLKTLKGHQGAVYGVAWSPDSQIIASASRDNTIKIWSKDGTLLTTIVGHDLEVYGVAFSPDSQTIASASWDKTVKLWKSDGTLLKTLKGHSDWVDGVAWSPDSQTIASASRDHTVKLWNRDGTLLETLEGHQDWVHGVAFSPDSRIIASVSRDKTVKLWSRDGKLLQTFKGHKGAVFGVAWSPDAQIIASASRDKTVKLWNSNGTLLTTLKGHSDEVLGVSFSPDSQTIASASSDKKVIVWNKERVLSLEPLSYACDWVGDYLNNDPSISLEEQSLCNK